MLRYRYRYIFLLHLISFIFFISGCMSSTTTSKMVDPVKEPSQLSKQKAFDLLKMSLYRYKHEFYSMNPNVPVRSVDFDLIESIHTVQDPDSGKILRSGYLCERFYVKAMPVTETLTYVHEYCPTATGLLKTITEHRWRRDVEHGSNRKYKISTWKECDKKTILRSEIDFLSIGNIKCQRYVGSSSSIHQGWRLKFYNTSKKFIMDIHLLDGEYKQYSQQMNTVLTALSALSPNLKKIHTGINDTDKIKRLSILFTDFPWARSVTVKNSGTGEENQFQIIGGKKAYFTLSPGKYILTDFDVTIISSMHLHKPNLTFTIPENENVYAIIDTSNTKFQKQAFQEITAEFNEESIKEIELKSPLE